jgi:SAM-dependent methyltransferase
VLTNSRENWEDAYAGKSVTYRAEPETPTDLEQLWHYGVVEGYIKKYLSDLQAPRVLETGCGGARNALYLALNGYPVTCADYSPEAIRLAKSNFEAHGAAGSFVVDDLLDSRIPENSFDCVMSFGLLEHFEDLEPVVRSLTRVIRPGGLHIHLVIPKKFSTQTLVNVCTFPFKLFINLVVRRQPLKGILRRSYRNFPHYENTYSWQQYWDQFERGGNAVLECAPGGLALPFLYWTSFVGLGHPAVKVFGRWLLAVNERVTRSTSPVVRQLSQTFTIVARKR